jgi:hypothetical protein
MGISLYVYCAALLANLTTFTVFAYVCICASSVLLVLRNFSHAER